MMNIFSQLIEVLPFRGLFAITAIEPLSPALLNRLNEDERQYLETLVNEKRRREFAASRHLLRQLAAEWGLPDEEFIIFKNTLGNPFAKTAAAQFEVSIAHINDEVFCGLSQVEPIGVDLEPVDRKVSKKLRERMLHPEEKKNEPNISTIRLWTIKEACIKLRGKGLRLNMNDVSIRQEGPCFFAKLDNDKKAKICSFRHKNNWLAIAFYL